MDGTFDSYQKQARQTAIYPNIGNNIVYPTLGLCGESGEFAEKVKKLIRDNNGIMNDEWKRQAALEVGDVLWYLSNLCDELGIALSDVAIFNLAKLKRREEEGKLKGDGDDR